MHRHFTEHANIEKLIRDRKPYHILELGSLNGENTSNLIKLQKELGFSLTIISDDLPDNDYAEGVTYIKGVSYKEIPKLVDNSIDLCLLDTDHNYWTLIQELVNLDSKLTVGAMILIHDVSTFYYNTGLADWYADGSAYPLEEIMSTAKLGSLGVAIIHFLGKYPFNYHLTYWTEAENGLAIIQKNEPQVSLSLLRPGDKESGKRKGMVNA